RFDNPRAEHQGLDFLLLEHQWRQIEARLEHVADTRFALDRYAAGSKVPDVAIDRALRDLKGLAQVARSHGCPLAAEQLNDLEQAIGAAHVALPCGKTGMSATLR